MCKCITFKPLCEAMEDEVNRKEAMALSKSIHHAVMRHFYSDTQQILIVNKPWLAEEAEPRYCDRSLATAVMFDQIPQIAVKNATKILAEPPENMGFSYPANAGWRYWALAKGNRMDVVIDEIRNKWSSLASVNLNNTLQEDWEVQTDSNSQWSHCPVVPLYILYMGILGFHPLKPGFEEISIRPQLADITSIKTVAQTIKGPINFESEGVLGNRRIKIQLPKLMKGYLTLDGREKVKLSKIKTSGNSYIQYVIPGGVEIKLKLKYA